MLNTVTQLLMLAMVIAPADEATPAGTVNVTIVLRGADSGADIEVLLRALRTTKGVKVLTTDVDGGFRKFNNRFTTPIVVAIPLTPGDDDANVGALATAVAEAKTRNAEKYPPGVNLLLYTNKQLDESSISALRSSLSRVNGLEVNQPGGLGANIADGWCWVQLENAGGAMLREIEKQTSTSGTDFRRLQND